METTNINLMNYPLDVTIISTALIVLVFIVLYYAHREKLKTLPQIVYGSKKISIFAVAGSVGTTYYATSHFIMISTRSYQLGLKSLYRLVAHVGSIYFAIFVFSPIFYKTKLLTIFVYLEKRFGKATRIFGSVHFIIAVTTHSSIAMHALAGMVYRICGISHFASVTIVIAICVFYFITGGAKAIMWANTLRGITMFASLSMLTSRAIMDLGGYSHVWKTASEGGRTDNIRFDISLVEDTFWSTVGYDMMFLSYLYGLSPLHIQLASCSNTLKKYRLSLLLGNILDGVYFTAITVFSFVMYASVGNCDSTPNASNIKTVKEELIPLFIIKHSSDHSGLFGFAIVGIAGASLTTVASVIYLVSFVTLEDLLLPLFINEHLSDERILLMMKLLAQLYGGIILFFTFSIASIKGFSGLIYIFLQGYLVTQTGMFTLGMLFHRPNQKGIFAATIIVNLFIIWIAVGKILSGNLPMLPELSCPEKHEELNSTWSESTNNINFQSTTEIIENGNLNKINETTGKKRYASSLFLLSAYNTTIIAYVLFLIVGYFISYVTGTDQEVPPELHSPIVNLWSRRRTPLQSV